MKTVVHYCHVKSLACKVRLEKAAAWTNAKTLVTCKDCLRVMT